MLNKVTRIRESNFELLRIVAMLMVLVLHVDEPALGPIGDMQNANALTIFGRVFFKSFAVGAVDIFVMISGWFGIKASVQGLSKFLFQCWFIIFAKQIIGYYCGFTSFSISSILEGLLFHYGWFIPAYIGLYILSPVLNGFIEHKNRRAILMVLGGFFVFQTFFGYGANLAYIHSGYSTFSFIGLYLLARYLRLHGRVIQPYGWVIWILSLVVMIIVQLLKYYHLLYIPSRLDITLYISPLVILNATGLILWFANSKSFYNKYINFIAASSFAAYLCHTCNEWTRTLYLTTANELFQEYSNLMYLTWISLFIVCVYFASILFDQMRIYIWRKILVGISRDKCKKDNRNSFLTLVRRGSV